MRVSSAQTAEWWMRVLKLWAEKSHRRHLGLLEPLDFRKPAILFSGDWKVEWDADSRLVPVMRALYQTIAVKRAESLTVVNSDGSGQPSSSPGCQDASLWSSKPKGDPGLVQESLGITWCCPSFLLPPRDTAILLMVEVSGWPSRSEAPRADVPRSCKVILR